MAQDVTFDSERYEKSQRIKRYAIPLGALLGVIVIAVVLALILRGSRGKPVVGGEDTPYPYSWAAGKNGAVTLELESAAAPGYRWTAPASDASVTVTENQNGDGDRSVFTLTPLAAGRTVLVFLLEGEDAADCIYERSVLVEIADDGKSLKGSLIGVSGRELLGVVSGGENSPWPYTVRQDADGDVMITVPAGAWTCVSENEAVAAVLGVLTHDETAVAFVRPGEAGIALVHLSEEASGAEITLGFHVDDAGIITLAEHRFSIVIND